MIKYRPKMDVLKYSIREEQTFDTVDDMLRYVFEHWSRVVAFMGAKEPFRPDEITISSAGSENQLTGWKDEHMVLVRRMSDIVLSSPMCIGFCGK